MELKLIMLDNPMIIISRDNSQEEVAGTNGLPSIDFSALSEEDCKKIGHIDIKKLSYDWLYDENTEIKAREGYPLIPMEYGFIEGFKKAQSLNDKKFSLDDLEKAYDSGRYSVINKDIQETFENFIKSISKPKVFDIEVEIEKDFENHPELVGNPREEWEYPKIENNKIKITKIH